MQTNTANQKVKLSEMGTTGLIQYAITGSLRMRGARIGKVLAIIAKRYNRWETVNAMRKAINAAFGMKG